MNLIELEINNIRGIRHLVMRPDSNNVVISGPNGSGKSGVVDALDFLLTGEISRLKGSGTGGISLRMHGPHIDQLPAEAMVRAIVRLPKLVEPVELRRSMDKPQTLSYDKKFSSELKPLLAIAQRGQHVLTRRELLKFITAEPKDRAAQIQSLLNINEIEDIRTSLVRVSNDLDTELKASALRVKEAQAAVAAEAQLSSFDPSAILTVINQDRQVLGGQPILGLSALELKKDLSPPAVIRTDANVNMTIFERSVEQLRRSLSETAARVVGDADQELRQLVENMRSDVEAKQYYDRYELTRLGLQLSDDSGICPLCGWEWQPDILKDRLDRRIQSAEIFAGIQKRVSELRDIVYGAMGETSDRLRTILPVALTLNASESVTRLEQWLADTASVMKVLVKPVDTYPSVSFSTETVRCLTAPLNVDMLLVDLLNRARSHYPTSTPEQTVWDTLTRLGAKLSALDSTTRQAAVANLVARRAVTLLAAFHSARNEVLEHLYSEIRDEFVELYRFLHKSDEGNFAANLEPTPTGLNVAVDFYGRGSHPPHALHSEGHQDSMGLCLYLVLAERLNSGLLDIVILDDVVMSVDSDHRRDVCRLIAQRFPKRQFIITTHDHAWASQLWTEGVVDRKNWYEFHNWSVEAGPSVSIEPDFWNKIRRDLSKGDVSTAAGRLRRSMEQFFSEACDAWKAPVVYKSSHQWELGELLGPGYKQFCEVLAKAKVSAQSWNDLGTFQQLVDFHTTLKAAYVMTNEENWAVNASVHYNNWASLTASEFAPVVIAYENLCSLFQCSGCGGMMYVLKHGNDLAVLKCNCGEVNWNLVPKPKK